MSHAILSPSSSSRWLVCTPSARLEDNYPDKTTSAAAEGTTAHRLAELLILSQLGKTTTPEGEDIKTELEKVYANEYYNESMQDHIEGYVAFVFEKFNEARVMDPFAKLITERKLDLTLFIPDGFGTGDVGILAQPKAFVIDLKYGKGVKVSGVENKQARCYALGWVEAFGFGYDIEEVESTIYQPRIDNISTFTESVADLYAWAKTELKPKAELAFKGEGDLVPGDHCQFCRHRVKCKALADYMLELAKYDFQPADTLQPEEIAEIVLRKKVFVNWIDGVADHALEEAKKGVKFPGLKLVEGRSVRVITSEEKLVKQLGSLGYADDQIYKPQELLGITALEKLVGKKKFEENLSGFLTKPPGSPTLVSADDKRPELNSTAKAVEDFEGVED